MKTQDVPPELREFYAHFKKLEYQHDYVTVFDDFLTATMNYFTPPGQKGTNTTCFNRYTQEERLLIGGLIPLTLQIFDKQINDSVEWFDPFGDFYQILASRGKQSALGQFFTPSCIVNFMTQLQGDKAELTGKGLTILDPACGSGRFLIAYHAHFPGNYVYGEDLDPMCCKMACINLMIHGCEGEIVNHNSLDPNHYIQGWKINSTLRKTGLPSITALEKEQSFVYRMWQNQIADREEKRTQEIQKEKDLEIKKVGLQLGIFA